MKFFKQLKLAAIALAFGVTGAQAATVGLPMLIEEGSVPNSGGSSLFWADQLSGQYDEVVTFQDATHFTTVAIFRAGAWYRNGSVVTEGQILNTADSRGGYNLYAKFIGSGTYSTSVVDGNIVTTFSATQNAIQLWVDEKRDTVYEIPASVGATPAMSDLSLVSGSLTDDYMLGSASTTVAAGGNSNTGLANGNFEIIFGGFSLTDNGSAPDGEKYFLQPRPFHMTLDLNGNFQSLTPTVGGSVLLRNSSANAFFVSTVPEPGALALVGAAFLAVGVASKRRKSA